MEISDAMLASALVKVKEYEVSAIPDNSYINHTFSLEFETSMDNLISSFNKKEKPVSFYRNALTKAAVIIIVLCVGAFSLMMISPQARADFRNAVVEFYETHIKFYFITNTETPTDFSNYKNVYVEYIPQGFLLKEKYEEYEAIGYRYENETENLVYDVYVSLNDGLSILTDKDKNNIERISISGRESYLISGENDGKPYSTLILTGNKITVTIYGHLSMEEVIKIGESVKEK
ncbi:MAG: DUF4367 domain-containing protein [Clostridia bacterium]|nr:DUF4367 domain-containing protein [Clostridia bacterium]MBQ6874385.1 DUF4367 domain-containing protein [Clostridia bacterium]